MKKQYFPPYMEIEYITFADIICTSQFAEGGIQTGNDSGTIGGGGNANNMDGDD